MRGPFSFITTGRYEDSFVPADPATVRVDVYTDEPVTALLYRGPEGQALTVGEFPMDQSQAIPGATGVAVKTLGTTPAHVTIVCWQQGDPLPVAVPVGQGQIPSPTPPVPPLTTTVVLSGAGTYVPSSVDVTGVIVELVGGGGAGGGVTGGANTHGAGGGGSGAYLRRTIITPAASYAYSVGAGGASGGAGGDGGDGGDSTFGTDTAGGGLGAVHAGSDQVSAAGNGGVAAPGAGTTVFGGHGQPGSVGYGAGGWAGSGGASIFGGSQRQRVSSGDGQAGNAYGSGGCGALDIGTVTDRAGGAGAAGIIVVTEFS